MTTTLPDFSDLKALFINCTLKRSPEPSNTQGLVDASAHIMREHGIGVDIVRAIDHDIATGVWPDMREHGAATDDWPEIFEKVLAAAARGADRLLAVTEAERVSAAATYALIKTVDDRCAGLRIDLLFNRSNLSVATGGFDEIDAATRHFLRRGIDFAGAVPDDDRLRTTMAD